MIKHADEFLDLFVYLFSRYKTMRFSIPNAPEILLSIPKGKIGTQMHSSEFKFSKI